MSKNIPIFTANIEAFPEIVLNRLIFSIAIKKKAFSSQVRNRSWIFIFRVFCHMINCQDIVSMNFLKNNTFFFTSYSAIDTNRFTGLRSCGTVALYQFIMFMVLLKKKKKRKKRTIKGYGLRFYFYLVQITVIFDHYDHYCSKKGRRK